MRRRTQRHQTRSGTRHSDWPAPWRTQYRSRLRPEPKRLLDLTLGSVLLVLAAPALIAATLALAMSRPPGGVFVRDYRTGLKGHPFILRTLRTRRFRLDLLSRLPLVVRGRLSLVGPAPLKIGSPGSAAPWRGLVRPGLTGLAQVRRHSRLPWDEATLLDQHYVEHHWIGLDLAILARTLPALLIARAHARAASGVRPDAWPRTRPYARLYSRPNALALVRPRAGSSDRRGQGPLSDTDHRSRRYIAAR
ncbi:sugar transferase [Streptomyces sp. AK02-01A]|uniref:sugar transferase n=1 Tax=Streptomyces sp. AK02-01A TaxID=3028648 RepID=UPI0029BB5D79|nr:sugar transferase [Streptomyces sp. AK02-01A]MDX3854019.1 sugar transferase [Streptomyces sp. AK02-01A]